MRQVLHDLYFGNIDPIAEMPIRDDAYRQATERIIAAEEELASLEGAQKQAFEALTTAQHERDLLTGERMFIMGARLGAQMILELLSIDNDVSTLRKE